MVEKELMDLIQIFSWIATATGVCFAAYYYIMTLRNASKAQKIRVNEEISKKFHEDKDFLSRRLSILTWKWNDYDDFQSKYGRETNFEANVILWQVQFWYDSLGWVFKNKVADIREMDEIIIYNILLFWRKLEPIILESRKRSTNLLWKNYYMKNFEWLANVCEQREKEIIQVNRL